MAIIATGVNKKLTIKRQTGLGVFTPVTGGKSLRRVTSTLDKAKAAYSSAELKPSQQIGDMRHGVVSVSGAINGELSVGGYQDFMESICRQNSLASVASTARTDIVTAVTSGALGTVTTTAGQFVTEGLRPGMVIRAAGFTAPATALNGINLLIVAINATGKTMTVLRLDGQAFIAKTETGSVTFTSQGKHTFVPQTNQTRDYYMVEHHYSDINQSELFKDCVVSQMDVTLPPSGLATVNFSLMGIDMTPVSGTPGGASVAQLTSPTAATTGPILAAANGALILNGAPVALVTGLNFSVKGGHTTIGGVVGSNAEPDIFPGTVTVDGSATVLFQDATVRDLFLNETEVTLIGAFTGDNTGASQFTSFAFPRVKFGGATKDDGNKGLVMTMPFTALENIASNEKGFQTTFMVQDSSFA